MKKAEWIFTEKDLGMSGYPTLAAEIEGKVNYSIYIVKTEEGLGVELLNAECESIYNDTILDSKEIKNFIENELGVEIKLSDLIQIL